MRRLPKYLASVLGILLAFCAFVLWVIGRTLERSELA